MPAYASLLERYSLVVVRGEEPFELQDLYTLATDRMTEGQMPDDLNMPLLLDLRRVDLLRFGTADFQILMRKRADIGKSFPNNPCAYVGRDDGAFGMLRMMSAYATINNVRDEQHQLVTDDIAEAVNWLYPHLSAPPGEEAQLLSLVR
ncbi:hypothetical protein [Pacificoceanicola onchidii]|uniref:hypothetical protein n=1 Tax=Pacificoceanicola onchidii TaxID=2562685 RepID=UPI0010A3E07D|nr:hypothetical protein [Pacificoceanicola onchidii]